MKPSAIVVGASCGIGLELCRLLASRHYRLGIAARRSFVARTRGNFLSLLGHIFHPAEGAHAGILLGHGPVFRDFNFEMDVR